MADRSELPGRNEAVSAGVKSNGANGHGSSSASSPIRVIIADAEPIYRVGMKKILAVEDDIRVVAQTENFAQTVAIIAKYPADVILFEVGLAAKPADAISEILAQSRDLKIILLAPDMSEQETLDYLRRGIRGMVTRAISPDLLIKCIRKVHDGETWLDNRGVNWIVEAYRTQATQLTSSRNGIRLSDKELLIISGVTQGMKNKEIAADVGTTEQVVKNYLRKIYDKLGVNDRLELALYCMHHRLLERFRPGSVPASESQAAAETAILLAGANNSAAKSHSR
jgi:DNA-binding NarL/FixJ family response regulator